MNKKLTFYTLVALVTASTITVSITDTTKAQQQNQSQAPRSAIDRNTEVDKSFIEMMIPHHQGAVEMAQMAVNKAKSPEVKKLAGSIIKDQNREIGQMRTWYKQWYGTEVPMMGMNMQMHHGMGQEMMQVMQEMMVALKNASNFDREFLRQMISHHEMALMMAGMVVDGAVHPETRKLADSIIKSQSAEINKMGQLSQTNK